MIAFIFADLIVLPIVLAYRKYYGTAFALRTTALMFVTTVLAALVVDGLFSLAGLIPETRPERGDIFTEIEVNYKLFLNATASGRVRGPDADDNAPCGNRRFRRRRGNLAPRPGTPAVASLMTDIEQADQLRKLAIIPAYNEEGMVGQVVRGIRRHAPEFDIVVVDDGSTDRTFAEASAEGVTVIRHLFNLGSAARCSGSSTRRQRVRRRRAGRRRRPAQASTSTTASRRCARAAMPAWCAGADSRETRATRCRSAAGSET